MGADGGAVGPKPPKPPGVVAGTAFDVVEPKPPKPLEGVEEYGNPPVLVAVEGVEVAAVENDWEKAPDCEPGNPEGPLRPFK